MGLFKSSSQLQKPDELQKALDQVCSFGIPVLYGHDDGTWYCSVRRKHRGAEISVESKHNEPSAIAALHACLRKIEGLR